MKLPCKNCLCVCICRHKSYSDLFNTCCLLDEYVASLKWSHLPEPPYYRMGIYKILKPTMWNVDNKGYLI